MDWGIVTERILRDVMPCHGAPVKASAPNEDTMTLPPPDDVICQSKVGDCITKSKWLLGGELTELSRLGPRLRRAAPIRHSPRERVRRGCLR